MTSTADTRLAFPPQAEAPLSVAERVMTVENFDGLYAHDSGFRSRVAGAAILSLTQVEHSISDPNHISVHTHEYPTRTVCRLDPEVYQATFGGPFLRAPKWIDRQRPSGVLLTGREIAADLSGVTPERIDLQLIHELAVIRPWLQTQDRTEQLMARLYRHFKNIGKPDIYTTLNRMFPGPSHIHTFFESWKHSGGAQIIFGGQPRQDKFTFVDFIALQQPAPFADRPLSAVTTGPIPNRLVMAILPLGKNETRELLTRPNAIFLPATRPSRRF